MTHRLALTAWLLAMAALPAAAQDAPREPAPPLPVVEIPGPHQQDWYQAALQSIAEGRKHDASAELERVIRNEPLHAGAWLDLALIQCSLGHAEEAFRLFGIIEERFKPPPAFLELIASYRQQGCDRWEVQSQASLTLARGIDQNVNQGPSASSYSVGTAALSVEYPVSPEFRPKHDQYTSLSGDYLRDLTSNGTVGIVQFQFRRNDELKQYDNASLFGSVESPWRLGNFSGRHVGTAGLLTLGGHLYQRQAQLQERVTVPLPGKVQLTMMTSMTRLNYVTLNNFDSSTAELRGVLSYSAGAGSVRAAISLLNDHAMADRPGGNRHGQVRSVLFRQNLGMRITGELGYTDQTWQSATAYAPGALDIIRQQRTQSLTASLFYPIGKNQMVQLEARKVRNQENIPIFQYNNRQLQLSWQWQGL